ncbi:unnamed protein product [Amoebophrya sp. A25]|nr:unnamed protein product [Amoebophrya sp. A25]|eukprot:GSA25T00014838001.1
MKARNHSEEAERRERKRRKHERDADKHDREDLRRHDDDRHSHDADGYGHRRRERKEVLDGRHIDDNRHRSREVDLLDVDRDTFGDVMGQRLKKKHRREEKHRDRDEESPRPRANMVEARKMKEHRGRLHASSCSRSRSRARKQKSRGGEKSGKIKMSSSSTALALSSAGVVQPSTVGVGGPPGGATNLVCANDQQQQGYFCAPPSPGVAQAQHGVATLQPPSTIAANDAPSSINSTSQPQVNVYNNHVYNNDMNMMQMQRQGQMQGINMMSNMMQMQPAMPMIIMPMMMGAMGGQSMMMPNIGTPQNMTFNGGGGWQMPQQQQAMPFARMPPVQQSTATVEEVEENRFSELN